MAQDPKPVTPWPVWGRVLFFVVFGLVILAAIFAAAQGGSLNWTAARVAIIVVAVPGLALLLVTTVLRSRVHRSATRLGPQLATALDELRAEQAKPADDRASGASHTSLATAHAALQDAQRRLAADDVEGATASLAALHETTTAWRSSFASGAVADCERSARSVRRTTEAIKRQRR